MGLIKIEELVNLRPGAWTWSYSKESLQNALRAANCQRQPEIADFVASLTAMFERIGMQGVCSLCFRGHLADMRSQKGCCGSCEILLEDRCANKPMGCATYMCGSVTVLFPRTKAFLDDIRVFLVGTMEQRRNFLPMGCFGGSTLHESQLQLSPTQRYRLREATRRVDGWQERA